MKPRIKRDQHKQAGGRFWLLGRVWHGKPSGDLATSAPRDEVRTSPVRSRELRPVTSVRRLVLHGLLGAFLAVSASAQTSQNIPDVTAITLEDLMNLQVTSVSSERKSWRTPLQPSL